jgi:hypothetical protein
MKKITYIFIVILFFQCVPDDEFCPGFDANIPEMEFFLFPLDKDIIEFNNNKNETIALKKNNYEVKEAHIITGNFFMRDCASYIRTRYKLENYNLNINNSIYFQSFNLDITKNSKKIFEFNTEVSDEEFLDFNDVKDGYYDTLKIKDKFFLNVNLYHLNDDLGSVFIAKNKGLVALTIQNDTLVVKN